MCAVFKKTSAGKSCVFCNDSDNKIDLSLISIRRYPQEQSDG